MASLDFSWELPFLNLLLPLCHPGIRAQGFVGFLEVFARGVVLTTEFSAALVVQEASEAVPIIRNVELSLRIPSISNSPTR